MVSVVKQTVHTKILHYYDCISMSVLLRFFPYGKIKRLGNGSLIWIVLSDRLSRKTNVVVINDDTYVFISVYDKSCIFGHFPETISLISANEFEKTMRNAFSNQASQITTYPEEKFVIETPPTSEEASDDDMLLVNNQMSYYVFSPPEEKAVILEQLRRRINFTMC